MNINKETLKAQLQGCLEKQASTENPDPVSLGYLMGYMNKEASVAGKVIEHALPFTPLIGGGLSGIYHPVNKRNRLASIVLPGTTGFLGGLGGGLAGAGAGLIFGGPYGDDDLRLAAALSVLGASLGTGVGTHLGQSVMQ